ncbi:MAG: hypothetical protein KDJ65_03865 [Anaerolineae bacterium]|nr:hypothetical protein [Anaerolineae bacterium]
MTNYQSDWVFNLTLKFAVIICLSVLALSLIIGTGPLTALMRSSIAFMTFSFLGWVTSLVWDMPLEEENTKDGGDQSSKDTPSENETQLTDKEQSTDDNNSNHEAVEEV